MTRQTFQLFPTKLTSRIIDDSDMTDGLWDLVHRQQYTESSNLLTQDDENLRKLAGYVHEEVSAYLRPESDIEEYEVGAFTFANNGSYASGTLAHGHSGHLVALFYVRVDADNKEPLYISDAKEYWGTEPGRITFHDPRFNGLSVQETQFFRIAPVTGQMVVFPSYLWHSVTAHDAKRARLALATNLHLKRKDDTYVHAPLAGFMSRRGP